MHINSACRLVLAVALLAGASRSALGTDILIGDAQSQPESLTVAPDGTLFVGSASSPFVYRVRSGAGVGERFIDASAEGAGTFFFGMLADAGSGTLWTCQLTPIPGSAPVRRRTAVRAFNMATGAAKLRWNLPGDNSTCNDLALGPDHALYVTDTANGRIFRMPRGASAAELFLEDRTLMGVDGITFLDGVLYVNNVVFNKLYRIPVDANGRPGKPEDIWMDQPVRGPDGMRAAGGRLFVAENGSGRISAMTVHGDRATVTVLREGLKTPTGIEPAGDTLWFTERAAGRVDSMPMPR